MFLIYKVTINLDIMETPVLTWSLTVALLVVLLILRLSALLRHRHRSARQSDAVSGSSGCHSDRHHAIGVETEEQMLYVPGDPNPLTVDDNDTNICTQSDFADYD